MGPPIRSQTGGDSVITGFAHIPLTKKEGEGLMWGLAQIGDHLDREPTEPTDPLYILLQEGYTRPQIKDAVNGLWEVAYGDWLGEDWPTLERLILRLCVESTSWISVYRTTAPTRDSPALINEALTALRTLSAKLDKLGVEINHIPYD